MQGYGAKPEYAYAALTAGKYCSCGNMPPKEERFSQCRIPCDGAPDEYCGGDQASWFSTGNGPESKYLYRIEGIESKNMFRGATVMAHNLWGYIFKFILRARMHL